MADANGLAIGLYRSASRDYYPGWHEPATLLNSFVSLRIWNGLDSELQAIVTKQAFHNARGLPFKWVQ